MTGSRPTGADPDTHAYRVVERHERFRGPVFEVRSDEITMPGGGTGVRDYIIHKGVVAVVVVDEQRRVLLIRQYRHPVGQRMWELPAGLMDVAGESPAVAAAREFAEETGLVATSMEHLLDVHTSPGYSDELVHVFYADSGVTAAAGGYERRDEEAELTRHWIPLDEALAMIGRGEITNGICQVGVYAATRRLGSDSEPAD